MTASTARVSATSRSMADELRVGRRARGFTEHFHAARDRAQVVQSRDVLLELPLGRQELVDRRIEQPNGHRVRSHRAEDADEIGALYRQQPVERGTALLRGFGHDHVDHDRQAVRRVEHALRAAEPDALRAVAEARSASSGVSAFARTPSRDLLSAHPSSLTSDGEKSASTVGTSPRNTWPLLPSMVITSPSLITWSPTKATRIARPRGCPRRPRRRACPCRGRRPLHARSCRRGW